MPRNDKLALVADALRKEAKRNTGKDPSFRIFEGWKFGMSFGPVPLPERKVVDAYKGPVGERAGFPEMGMMNYEQLATLDTLLRETGAMDRQWISQRACTRAAGPPQSRTGSCSARCSLACGRRRARVARRSRPRTRTTCIIGSGRRSNHREQRTLSGPRMGQRRHDRLR